MWFANPEFKDQVALVQGEVQLSYHELEQAVKARCEWLLQQQAMHVAVAMENSIEWVLFDLACQLADVCCVPVPGFFSQTQVQHLLKQSDIDLLLTDSSTAHLAGNIEVDRTPFTGVSAFARQRDNRALVPEGTSKITFTSGSTGAPKGVCLSVKNQLTVAHSLADAIAIEKVRHLCLLPLATLLENIAGVYAPLMVGGAVVLANDAERGFSGSRLIEPQQLLGLISKVQPQSLILVPELLTLLMSAVKQGWQAPDSLQFIAVGGAKVAAGMVEAARALGLPVYQGYGLSECASVVALNTQNADAASSAGQPLPHNQLYIENGELIVEGNLFLGYLNQPDSFYPKCVATGDLVEFTDNTLHILGRRKNLLITSFGRNISPEWVEAELMASGYFRDVIVYGDSQPYCGALLMPISDAVDDSQIDKVIAAVNQQLPDYARIANWVRLQQPLVTIPGLVTPTGKPVRDAILQHFHTSIEQAYAQAGNAQVTGAVL